jgi:hypothetical protein
MMALKSLFLLVSLYVCSQASPAIYNEILNEEGKINEDFKGRLKKLAYSGGIFQAIRIIMEGSSLDKM